VLRLERNQGKGQAILEAVDWARGTGKTHIVTLDADGQHLPEEVFKLLPQMRLDPLAIVLGSREFSSKSVPWLSRFGRSFSNFWLRVQTGRPVSDVQSGFRIYPVALFEFLRLRERRYSFEVEVLVKALWAGFKVLEVPIEVYYPEPKDRVSHFDVLFDNLSISWLNFRLTFRAVLPLPHKRYGLDDEFKVGPLHPLKSLRLLLSEENTPLLLAASSGLGVLIGSFPIYGLSYMLILLLSGYLGLNKITALASNQVCMPPIVPALCIEVGYFVRHGEFLTEISLQTLGSECFYRLWEWIIGACILGPTLALLAFLLVLTLAKVIQIRLAPEDGR
jgi:glycosyltransferase involved in cell wall biosynthesis